jgi:8-oxo-dGTP diphosphatase
MIQIATALLFDRDGKFLIYLRDNKETIPFPNHWDLFGGHIEDGETPEVALRRELQEEIRVTPTQVRFLRTYVANEGDARPNTKHVFVVSIEERAADLTLYEGQELRGIDITDHHQFKFANILGRIVAEYAEASGTDGR